MSRANARHDELLRRNIERCNGYVFKTVGDSFCAAFSTPSDAISAAVDVQRGLATEEWPAPIKIRVRIGLHTGECEQRDNDYFGPSVNRAARLEAIAHGGQILVSRATAEILQDSLPDGVALRDIGEHRLKDLGRPEWVFQVEADGLATEFPPVSSLDNPEFLHNLPEQVSSFVGRDGELARLCELVGYARVVTLTGPGGVGKTRLALQVAVELLDGSGDGVWFVDLAPLEDPELVAQTVANVLAVREEREHAISETLVNALRDRDILVVLDNCEHLIAAAATLVENLVQHCGMVNVLTTSREPLGIAGEHVYRVPSLTLPPTDEEDPDRLARSEAVRLFAERARQHNPDFSLDVVNAPAIARLCRRLDGIPLAIELATARLRSMSLPDLEARLDQCFRLLTGGSRTALPRQRTLQALISWSYDLLAEAERVFLDRLSVFAGGFDLDAAEAVALGDGVDEPDVLDTLAVLVDKSLVQADDAAGTVTTRYRLLETIRDFASTKLAERGEAEAAAVRSAHRDHYLEFATMARPYLDGHDQIQWLDRLEREHDNLRLALSYCLADPDPALGLCLAAELAPYWDYRGYGVEGVARLHAQLDRPTGDGARLQRGSALIGSGLLLSTVGNYRDAIGQGEEALEIARVERDDHLRSEALKVLAVARYRQGEFGSALALVDESLLIARARGDHNLAAYLLSMKGVALDELGQDGLSSYNEALVLFHGSGNRIRATSVLNNLACREMTSGDLRIAREHLDEALKSAEDLGDLELVSYILGNIGLAAYLKGHHAEGAESFLRSLEISRRNGFESQLGYALLGLALTSPESAAQRAAKLHGVVDALFEQLGEHLQGLESRLREADVSRRQRILGVPNFEAAYLAGKGMSREEAIPFATLDSE